MPAALALRTQPQAQPASSAALHTQSLTQLAAAVNALPVGARSLQL
jgi:hypothetical protein